MNALASTRIVRRICALAVTAAAAAAIAPTTAAAVPTAHWTMATEAVPNAFHAGDGADFYEMTAVNDGGAPSTGTIIVKDVLPAGLTVSGASAISAYADRQASIHTANSSMSCATSTSEGVTTVECKSTVDVPIDRLIGVRINVGVPLEASGALVNHVVVEGGGAATAETTTSTPVTAPEADVPYGAAAVSALTDGEGGIDTQAASQPLGLSTIVSFNVGALNASEKCLVGSKRLTGCASPSTESKDLEVALPPGLVGNPTAVPRCTQTTFQSAKSFRGCPADTQVGTMWLFFYGSATAVQNVPVNNIEPPAGYPAELGFSVSTLAHIPMLFHLRMSAQGYRLVADIPNITQQDLVRKVVMVVWGVPGAAAHDVMREADEPAECSSGSGCPSGIVPQPFLRLPSACTGPEPSLVFSGDSWQDPEVAPLAQLAVVDLGGMTGCGTVPFTPSVEVKATTGQAGALAGYDVSLEVPQGEEVGALETSDVRDVEVTLPKGTVISSSAANGLLACTEAQFDIQSEGRGACPKQSKIGKVTVHTPLLEQPLQGRAYVGQPECSPCTESQAEAGAMVRLLLEAEGSGVRIKLAGHTKINQATGQLTTVFSEDPQMPFSNLTLALDSGAGAPLVNPETCGAAVATARLTPWSAATATALTASPIAISGCSSPSFSPSVEVGMTKTAQAGAFSGFAVTLKRQDGQQDLGSMTMHTPPGLAGMLAKVPLCGEAEANAGTCAAASQIGTTTAVVGPGPNAYTISGGKVFLTGPYGGAPFGLSIVVPAEAGPFRLAGNAGNGNEVVRGSISVDPVSAELTITTAALPTAIDGVPLDLRQVLVNIDREGFMFNPTSCEPLAVSGTIGSSTGAAESVSYPFQAVNCASLPFHPVFKALTHAHYSRKNGAYLHVVIESGTRQANLKSVFVTLPGRLPSRSETLKRSCTEAQFAKDPAGCPAESKVGTATVYTPVLPVPLTGPAIFVSHGGEAFPDLDLVLKGDGVTIIQTGSTKISNGVTSSYFKTIPDIPVSRVDLVLPEKKYSALGASGNLCYRTLTTTKRMRVRRHGKWVHITRKVHHKIRRRLEMPTIITGQNGAVIKKTTTIAVTGCGGKAKRSRHGGGRAGRGKKS